MVANRMWLGVGACAVAAATIFSPVLALADDGTDNTNNSTGGVGDSAGAPNPASPSRGGVSRAGAAANANNAPAGPGRSANARAVPDANTFGPATFQNPLWWFGTPNPSPPPPAYTRTFEPLANLPGWSQGYYGWYRNMSFEGCVLGLSHTNTPGPYGTATNAISTGGC